MTAGLVGWRVARGEESLRGQRAVCRRTCGAAAAILLGSGEDHGGKLCGLNGAWANGVSTRSGAL
jgi:hypothetical protein